jgi:hypothetical protein
MDAANRAVDGKMETEANKGMINPAKLIFDARI